MTDRYATLLQQMRDDALHACDFGHADHIGVAYQALEEEAFFDALALFARGIQGAAARVGAGEKFNATVTLAFMSLIAERRAVGQFDGAHDFIARNQDLRDPNLLGQWYSSTRLFGSLARRVALMPDRSARHA